MTLVPVKPSKVLTANWLLFGPAKTGKTAAACSAPGPVMLLNADMPNATRYAHERYGDKIVEYHFGSLQTIVDVQTDLRANPGKWGTIVLDPVGNMRRVLVDDLSKGALRASLPIQGDAAEHLERFCRELCELPVNVVFVAHRAPLKDEATGRVEQYPQMGTTNPKYGQNLLAMVDGFGYTSAEVQADKSTRYVAQLRSRFPVLGAVEELDLSEWTRRIETAPKGAQDAPKGAERKAA